MPTFRIPVTWSVYGHYEIEAQSLQSAIVKAEDLCLPEGDYLDDSLEIEHECIEKLNPLTGQWEGIE